MAVDIAANLPLITIPCYNPAHLRNYQSHGNECATISYYGCGSSVVEVLPSFSGSLHHGVIDIQIYALLRGRGLLPVFALRSGMVEGEKFRRNIEIQVISKASVILNLPVFVFIYSVPGRINYNPAAVDPCFQPFEFSCRPQDNIPSPANP